jgi:hypothetical protein
MTIQEIFDNVFQAWMPFDFQFFFVLGLTCYAKPFFFQLVNGKCHIFPSKVSARRGDISEWTILCLTLQINAN